MIRVFVWFLLAMFINGPVIANDGERSTHGEAVKQEAEQASGFPVTVDLVVDEVADVSIGSGRFRAVAEMLLSWRGDATGAFESRTLTGSAIDVFFLALKRARARTYTNIHTHTPTSIHLRLHQLACT